MSYAVRVSNIPESLLYPVDGVQISKVANSQKYTINVQYAVQIQLDDSENIFKVINFLWGKLYETYFLYIFCNKLLSAHA